jgi:hypothetical protein
MNASATFRDRRAPCGRRTAGEEYEDHDDEVLLSYEILFDCGCRTIRHKYHDGAVSRTTTRHDGAVLVDELMSAQ